jgi:hypothetical protein
MRVLRKGFEASTAEGRTLDVDSRTKEDVGALGATFFTELNTDFFGECEVEGRGETGSAAKAVGSCSVEEFDTSDTVGTV